MPAVVLREVEPDDLPAFFEDQRDPASVAMASVPARDRTAFDAHWAQILARPDSIIRAVVADGQLAGNAVSWRAEDGRRFIGYWLTRTHWGRGIASAALQQFLALIEERPLFAITVEHNAASQRVLTRNGFVPDGAPPGERHFKLG